MRAVVGSLVALLVAGLGVVVAILGRDIASKPIRRVWHVLVAGLTLLALLIVYGFAAGS